MPIAELDDELAVQTPTERRSRFWSFESWDIWWTLFVGAGALFSSVRVGVGFGTLVFVGFALFWVFTMLSMPPSKNRFNDRNFMVPFWWFAEWRTAMTRGVIWKADEDSTIESMQERVAPGAPKHPSGVTERRKQRAIKRQVVRPFPFEAKAYRDLANNTTIGLAYHQGKQTYSMAFTAPGSSINSRSKVDQFAALQQLAEVLKVATLSAGLKGVGVGVGMNTRPQDQWRAPRTMLESCSLRTIAPSALVSGKPEDEYTNDDKIDSALHAIQEEIPTITVQSFKNTMLIVVTMSETSALRKASPAVDVSQREFRRLPIIRIRDIMLPKLRRIISEDIEVLDLAGIERYLRMARDAVTLAEFYDEYQERWLDERVAEATMKQTGEKVDVPPPVHDRYLPTRNINVGKEYANVDGTWFSLLDMTTFPASRLRASDADVLYDAMTPWMSMSVVAQAVSSRVEYSVANTSQSTGRDILDALGYDSSGARVDRKQRERDARSEQIDDAGVTMDYIIRFAILAPTRALLEEETESEIVRLSGLGLGPVRVSNRAQQWRKLLTTVTLIDCE